MKRQYLIRATVSALIILAFILGSSAGGLMASVSQFPNVVSGREASVDLNPMIIGGTPPYHCALRPGDTLPDGLVLSDDCIISGVHSVAPGSTEEVSPPFTVLVQDSANPSASTSFKISIMTRAQAPTLLPQTGQCTEKTQCTTQVAGATGGNPPYHYQSGSFADGAPPLGMIVDLNGDLTGKAPAAGTYTFGVCVVDSIGESDCGQSSVIIGATPTTTPTPEVASPDWISDFLVNFENAIGDVFGLNPVPTPQPTEVPPVTCPIGSYPCNAGCMPDGSLCHQETTQPTTAGTTKPTMRPTIKPTQQSTISGMCSPLFQLPRCEVEACSYIGPSGEAEVYYHTSRGNFYCTGNSGSIDCTAAAQKAVQACT